MTAEAAAPLPPSAPPAQPSSPAEAREPFSQAAFLALAAGLILHAVSFFSLRIDDAYIVLRYADNLRHGLGMTFNPGERVEGFTCPALVVLEAALSAAGLDVLSAVKYLGIVSGVAVVWWTMRIAGALSHSRWTAAAAGLVLVLQPSLAVACVNGLETAPLAACLIGALATSLLLESVESAAFTGLLLALATLLRPDAAIAAACIAGTQLWRERRERRGWLRARRLALVAAAILVPIEIGKGLYFGSWIPNTALAKLPAHCLGRRLSSGLAYLRDFSVLGWEILAAAGLAGLSVRAGAQYRSCALIALVWGVYVVTTGGDWMPGGRFLVPVVPLFALGLAASAAALARRARPAIAVAGSVGLVVYLLAGVYLDQSTARRIGDEQTQTVLRGSIPLARTLSLALPGSTAAMTDVGAVAYFSTLNVIDLGGLTDPAIARIIHGSHGKFVGHLFFPDAPEAKWIAQHVMDAKPGFVVLKLNDPFIGPDGPAVAGAAKPKPGELMAFDVQDAALALHPEFRHFYRYLCSTPVDLGESTMRYNLFARTDARLAGRASPAPIRIVPCQSERDPLSPVRAPL